MVGIQRLVTKSAETYNENARGRKPAERCRMRGPCLSGSFNGSPAFSQPFPPALLALWLGLGLLWLVAVAVSGAVGIGRVLGALMYRVAGDRRRIAARNLELCFPELSAAERSACSRKISPPPASPSSKWP
jgi:KDO2-lipid IV(A) lauroyltransferase